MNIRKEVLLYKQSVQSDGASEMAPSRAGMRVSNGLSPASVSQPGIMAHP